MKKIVLIIVFLLCIIFIPNVEAEELSNNQKALMETANAYYNKKSNIQYCSFRWNNYFSPEDATKDDNKYTVCSGFTFNTYREAFNIILPLDVNQMTAAGYNYYTKKKEIGETPDPEFLIQLNSNEITNIKTNLENNYSHETTTERKNLGLVFLQTIEDDYNIQLKVGDMVAFLWTSSGHVVIVDDITRENGVIKSIKLIHSTSDNKTKTTKLSINQNFHNNGTIRIETLDYFIGNAFLYNSGRTYTYFTIYRPLVNNTTYNKYDCESSLNTDTDYNINNFNCAKETKSYQITNSAKSRMKYSGIDIDKVVESKTNNKTIINNSTVNLGDELLYRITISNKGKTNYQDTISLIENISDLVEFKEFVNKDSNICNISGNRINCTIKKLNSGQSTVVEYKVKVKEDSDNLDNKVISTGSVDTYLKTATITNLIKTDKINEDKITNAYNKLKNSTTLSGIDFVNAVYKQANLGLEFNLDDFDITQLINNNMTDWTPVTLNKNNKYNEYVLNKYYSGILDKMYNSTRYSYLKEWGINHKLYGETVKGVTHKIDDIDRADTVYKDHLRTGDILIYKNNNDEILKENGDYAYIFVNGNFYGINKLTDGTSKNIFDVNATIDTGNADQSNYPYLSTLFGRDYYVILRPALKQKTANFADVSKKAWYYEPVQEAYRRGIIAGYSSTRFAPNDKVTRGQLVTFLYRIEGEPDTMSYGNPFNDVKIGEYYTEAVKWAAKKKIVNGYGNTGTFGPTKPIIRQDLAVILNNYAKYKGYSYQDEWNLSGFADYNKVKGGYAEPALKWAVKYKVMNGNNIDDRRYLSPFDKTTRAQAAAMIINFQDAEFE